MEVRRAERARRGAAAQRLGFSYEGVFRQATVYKGRNRDTAWYAAIDQEWPALRSAFERWLDPENFDGDGRQRTRLADLTSPIWFRGGRLSVCRAGASRSASLALLAVIALAATGEAQRRGRFGPSVQLATPDSFDGDFHFCRIMFRGNRYGDGGGWSVDYPRADINLSIRLSELTKTRVSFAPGGEPNSLVMRLTDETLFQCPFIMMTEVGAVYFDEEEAASLRNYLLKGGFLWADDFWGELRVGGVGERVLRKCCRRRSIRCAISRSIIRSSGRCSCIPKVPQIPSINHWMGSGGGTSERGSRQRGAARARRRSTRTTA